MNGDTTYGVRGAVRLRPTENITWDIDADYVSEDYANVLNVLDANGDRVSHGGILPDALATYFTGAKGRNNPYTNDVGSDSVTSNLNLVTHGVSLESITGYRVTNQNFLIDSFTELPTGALSTGAVPNATDGTYEQVSQEFKAVGKLFDNRLNYAAGFYYLHENYITDVGGGSTSAAGVFTVIADRTIRNSKDAPAVYAQFDYHLTDKLTATAGGRYTDEIKHFAAATNPGARGAVISTAGIAAAGIPLTLHTPLFTPHFGLQYQYSSNINFYATATNGFKSGGWNARATSNAAFTTFAPEKIWSEEIGMRPDLFDRKLRFNVTGFYALDRHFQVPSEIFINGIPVYTTTNPADLQDCGREFEVTWLPPVRHLTINSSLGLSSAKYVNPSKTVVAQEAACRADPGVTANANCNAGFVDIDGDLATPVRAPKVTWNMLVSYEWNTGPATLTPNVDISLDSPYAIGTTGSEASTHSSSATVNGAYVSTQWLLDAGVTFQPTRHPNLSFIAECRNCVMKNYPVSFLAPFQYLDKPGTWDVRLQYKF